MTNREKYLNDLSDFDLGIEILSVKGLLCSCYDSCPIFDSCGQDMENCFKNIERWLGEEAK